MIENPQDFVAWSLYTGPSNSKQITYKNRYWVTGNWSAINKYPTRNQIKRDIEERIELLVMAFRKARKEFKTPDRHFVVPEFFFRCKQGPYPNILLRLDKELLSPFDYIKRRLMIEFSTMSLESDQCTYTIFFGTILTCNVPGGLGFYRFLNSRAVRRRHRKLNEILRQMNSHLELMRKNNSVEFIEEKKTSGDDFWMRAILPNIPSKENTNYETSDSFKELSFAGTSSRLFTKGSMLTSDDLLNDHLENLTSFMADCRLDPLCTVRNRGISLHLDKNASEPEFFMHEKQYESTIDLPMGIMKKDGSLKKPRQITEWLANYPASTIIWGDKQPSGGKSIKSRIEKVEGESRDYHPHGGSYGVPILLPGEDIGIEICVDHFTQRLRRTVGMSISNGAASNNFPLAKQVIPSGGMQLLENAICARPNSPIFNADGLMGVYKEEPNGDWVPVGTGSICHRGITTGVYTLSQQSRWDTKEAAYFSHSQLAFTTKDSEVTTYDMATGMNNPGASTYIGGKDQPYNPTTDAYTIDRIEFCNEREWVFAAGAGELHHYYPKAYKGCPPNIDEQVEKNPPEV